MRTVDVGSWLRSMQSALRGETAADVPCDGCTACCRSAQFIAIEPDEVDTLARIPATLRFPAPGRPPGHVVLGYDEHGHCPMLVDDRCSIYAHRPRACRTYDCRVFAAAGVEPEQPLVAERVARWELCGDGDGHVELAAVRAAASFLQDHPDAADRGGTPLGATPRAVLAVELHDLFVDASPAPATVRVELERRRTQDGGD